MLVVFAVILLFVFVVVGIILARMVAYELKGRPDL